MALAVVAHESYHVLGYWNEAQVECYGMQSIWFVANKLGASVDESQALAALYATQMYPQRRTRRRSTGRRSAATAASSTCGPRSRVGLARKKGPGPVTEDARARHVL